MFYRTNSAPEPKSDSATNISKLFANECVYVWELLVYVSGSRKPTYTHIGAMRMVFSRVYVPLRKNPLVEGVNTEAARVEMYKLQQPSHKINMLLSIPTVKFCVYFH